MEYVAFGAYGGISKVGIFKIREGVEILKKGYSSFNAGLTSPVIHLDFSSDSKNLVLNSNFNQLMFADVES